MIRTCALVVVMLLAACGQGETKQDVSGAQNASDIVGGGIITVDQTPTDVAQYLRALPAGEPVAPGVTQRVRAGDSATAIEADLIDASSGNVIGLATYNLAVVNEQTRITLHLTQMTGLYADIGRQGVLADRIIEFLRRDLGDI